MKTSDEDRELRLADLLVEYETRLAAGDWSTVPDEAQQADASADERERLENARQCLLRLERIWPHQPLDDGLPDAIGRFRILRELGRGGFGIVYLAFDPKLDRQVALKVQRPEALLSPALRERFVREAKAAARLDHPHVAGVYEVGESGLRVWIASEYVDGESLAARLRNRSAAVEPKSAARFAARLADALAYAHEQGVLHRDLKPSNVLLHKTDRAASPDDLSAFEPKLIDFGLAKLNELGEVLRQETRTGALIGTPPYMAPEQAAGKVHDIGPATDVYGAGTILYELLAGRAAFGGDSDVLTLRRVVEEDPVEPRTIRPSLPADLEAICLKCLEKAPHARYASAASLAADLHRFLADQPTRARPLTRPQRLAKWARRKPAVAALVAVSILAVVVMLLGSAAYIAELRRARQNADASRIEAEQNAATARDQQEIANRYLYVSRMRLAGEILEQGNSAHAAELLAPYAPPSTEAFRRGFEWYHLRRRVHGERLHLAVGGGEVYAVAFSPDGRLLVSGSQDGLIRLWDVQTGALLSTLAGHTSCVNAVAYSPDGRLLASASCDHTIKLWHTSTHELLATLDRHSDAVLCLAFSPDGTRLATGGRTNLVALWDLAARTLVKTFEGPGGDVNFLAWRDDHNLIVPGDHQLAAWNVDTDAQHLVDEAGTRVLAISPDGNDTVVGLQDGTIRSVAELSLHSWAQAGRGYMARSLGFRPDGACLAVGYDDGVVVLTTWPGGGMRQTLPGHTAPVQALAFSPRGDQLATAGFDGTVKVWDLRFESLPRVESPFCMPTSVGPAHVLATSADLKYAALPTSPNQVEVFDVEKGKSAAALQVPNRVWALGFSDDGSSVYGCAIEVGQIWRWNWREDQLEISATLPARNANDLAFSPGARHLLVWHASRPPTFFDTQTGQSWWSWPVEGQRYHPRLIAFSNDGALSALGAEVDLARGGTAFRRKLLDLKRRRLVDASDEGVSAIGRTLVAVGLADHSISIVDRIRGGEICRFPEATAHPCLEFAPDGRTLAISDASGRVLLRNLATGMVVSHLETAARPSPVALRYAADGRSLALVSAVATHNDGAFSYGTCQIFVWSGTDEP